MLYAIIKVLLSGGSASHMMLTSDSGHPDSSVGFTEHIYLCASSHACLLTVLLTAIDHVCVVYCRHIWRVQGHVEGGKHFAIKLADLDCTH